MRTGTAINITDFAMNFVLLCLLFYFFYRLNGKFTGALQRVQRNEVERW